MPKRKSGDQWGNTKSRRLMDRVNERALTLHQRQALRDVTALTAGQSEANWNEVFLGRGMWHVGPGNTILEGPRSSHPAEITSWLHDIGYHFLLKTYTPAQVYILWNQADERQALELENHTDLLSAFIVRCWAIKRSISQLAYYTGAIQPPGIEFEMQAEGFELKSYEPYDAPILFPELHHLRRPGLGVSPRPINSRISRKIHASGISWTNTTSEWNNLIINQATWGQACGGLAEFI